MKKEKGRKAAGTSIRPGFAGTTRQPASSRRATNCRTQKSPPFEGVQGGVNTATNQQKIPINNSSNRSHADFADVRRKKSALICVISAQNEAASVSHSIPKGCLPLRGGTVQKIFDQNPGGIFEHSPPIHRREWGKPPKCKMSRRDI